VTKGGPGQSTEIMVFKLYKDGFIGLNLGSSGAQSVILMALVIGLTVLQFRFAEKKVTYR
jgi:sn-glycerol 3-phosphate transport system permease protein